MFKVDLEKAEEPEIKLPTSVGSSKKQDSSRKTSTSGSLTTLKLSTVWITTNCGNFLKRWNTRPPDLPPEKSVCTSKAAVITGHGTMDWFQIKKGCIWSPCLFNLYAEYITWNARLDEAQAGIKIVGWNINKLKYIDDTTLIAESEEEQRAPWWRWKRRVKKLAWNSTLKKTKTMASSPIASWQTDGGENGSSDRFYFPGLQNHRRQVTAAMKLKDICSLEEKLW